MVHYGIGLVNHEPRLTANTTDASMLYQFNVKKRYFKRLKQRPLVVDSDHLS